MPKMKSPTKDDEQTSLLKKTDEKRTPESKTSCGEEGALEIVWGSLRPDDEALSAVHNFSIKSIQPVGSVVKSCEGASTSLNKRGHRSLRWTGAPDKLLMQCPC